MESIGIGDDLLDGICTEEAVLGQIERSRDTGWWMVEKRVMTVFRNKIT